MTKTSFCSPYRDTLIKTAVNRMKVDEEFIDSFINTKFFSADQYIIVIKHLIKESNSLTKEQNPLLKKFYFCKHKSVQAILAKHIPKNKLPFLVGGDGKKAKEIIKNRLKA